MTKILLIGLGGFTGSVLRYIISEFANTIVPGKVKEFPYGTFVVNVLGCFLIGLLASLSNSRQLFNLDVRSFVFIGVLGGFTTFSAFGFETCELLKDGEALKAGLNIAVNIVLGLGAVLAGHVVARNF